MQAESVRTAASPATPHAGSAASVPAGPQLGELLGALSVALDMTEGQPPGHCLRSTWIGQQLGRAIGLPTPALRELYYTTLLKDSGCSSNAARICQLFLADDRRFKHDAKIADVGLTGGLRFVLGATGVAAPFGQRMRALLNIAQNGGEIARELIETRCTRGAEIARKLRFTDAVADGIASLDESWDGSGHPEGLAGERIPLYSRIALLCQVADVFHTSAGPEAARREVARRRARLLDPGLCDAFGRLADDPEFWQTLGAGDIEWRVLDLEPARQRQPVDEDYLDDIAAAFGQVVDAKSPFHL